MNKLALIILCLACELHAFSDITEVVILQTTDIHAHLSTKQPTLNRGNWLKLATLIKIEREKAGGIDHCLVIDCGDTIQGTLVGALSKGDISILVLDSLRYDSWILGNHELDFGVPRLKELLTKCQTPVINGNLTLGDTIHIPSYRVYEKSDVTIAVIGMNSRLLHYWAWGNKMQGFDVNKATDAIERVLPEVMAHNPDMIVLALHQGLMEYDKRNVNEVKEIAYRFPQIDLILGGHTHREFAGKKVANSWYVQPGSHGEFLAKVIAKVDRDAGRVLDIRSQLLSPANYPLDSACTKLVEPWIAKRDEFAAQPVCHVDTEVTSTGTPGVNCHMSEIICRAIAWKTNLPVVFHGVLSEVSWSANSYVTEERLFDTVPYENGIGKAELAIEELKEIIEEQQRYTGKRSFNGVYGLVVDIDQKTLSVDRITIPGKSHPLHANERIPVAFNSYVIAGAGGRFPTLRTILRRRSARLVDLRLNTRDILREYLKNSDKWKSPPFSWMRFRNGKK